MKNLLITTLVSVMCLIISASILNASSISDLEEGQFVVDIKHGQNISLISNKAKLSDIIRYISDKMSVDIKVEGNRSGELITVEIADTFLGDVLKKIIRTNYVIMFRKIDNQTMVLSSNLVTSGSSDKVTSGSSDKAISGSSNKNGNNPMNYNFPIRPGMKEWQQFETVEEMYEATQIPEDILQSMDTESLIKTCLDYPLLINITAFDTLQNGLNDLINKINGLKELLNRKDAGEKLFSEYQEMDTEEIVREKGNWTPEQEGAFLFKSIGLEVLLAQDKIISGISSSQRRSLAKESLSKFEMKSNHPDYYGFLGLAPCGLIMKRVMEKEGFIKSNEIEGEEVDAHNIKQILSDAKNFVVD